MDGSADFTLIDARSPRRLRRRAPARARSASRTARSPPSSLPDGPLVVYCWGPGCNAATKAGAKIADLGREVKEMLGGFEYYVREGYPVEGEQARPSQQGPEWPRGAPG